MSGKDLQNIKPDLCFMVYDIRMASAERVPVRDPNSKRLTIIRRPDAPESLAMRVDAVDVVVQPQFTADSIVVGVDLLYPSQMPEIPLVSEIEMKEPQVIKIVGESVHATSNALVGERPLPSGTTKKDPDAIRLLDIIDGASSKAMIDEMNQMEEGIQAFGEGGRDIATYGQDHQIVGGKLGKGEKITLTAATDAVDNTLNLVTYEPPFTLDNFHEHTLPIVGGEKAHDVSISIMALAAGEDGITELADTHWQKMIGPRVEGLSIKQSPREIIQTWLKASNLSTPEERKRFILTTLDRPDANVNGEIIEAAMSEGITLDMPNGGDVLATAFAGENEDGTIRAMLTRGGGPEVGLSAAIVRSLQNVKDLDFQARIWNADPQVMAQNEVWDLESVVPSEDVIVAIGLITDDNRYSGLRGVPVYTDKPIPDDQKVNMITTSSKGVVFSEYQRPQ